MHAFYFRQDNTMKEFSAQVAFNKAINGQIYNTKTMSTYLNAINVGARLFSEAFFLEEMEFRNETTVVASSMLISYLVAESMQR